MRITVHIEVVIEIDDVSPEQRSPMLYDAHCPQCGWHRQYETPAKARRGLAGHYVHCKGSRSDIKTLFDQLVTGKLGI